MVSISTGEGSLNGKLNNPVNFFGEYVLDRDGMMLRDIDAYRNVHIENALGINNIPHGKLGKIVNPSLIASEEDQEILLMFKARDLRGKIKLDCSPTIISPEGFGEFDKAYFACREKLGLFSITPYGKPKGARAIDIAKAFAEAIKSKSRFKLLKLSMFNAKLLWAMNLDALGEILEKTKEFKISANNNYASAGAITDYEVNGQKLQVLFVLKKADGQLFRTKEWFVKTIRVVPIKD